MKKRQTVRDISDKSYFDVLVISSNSQVLDSMTMDSDAQIFDGLLDLKEERSEVPNKIKGNEQLLNSAIEKVDNTIKDIENTLEAWKRGEEDNSLFYEVEKIQRRFKVEDRVIYG